MDELEYLEEEDMEAILLFSALGLPVFDPYDLEE
jgi:hypothetical protein